MRFIAILLCLSLVGCANPLLLQKPTPLGAYPKYVPPEPTYTWNDCDRWSTSQFTWSTIAKASGVLAGAGGLSAAFPEQQDVKWGLVSTGLFFGGLATVATFISDHYTGQFTQYCVRPAGLMEDDNPK